MFQMSRSRLPIFLGIYLIALFFTAGVSAGRAHASSPHISFSEKVPDETPSEVEDSVHIGAQASESNVQMPVWMHHLSRAVVVPIPQVADFDSSEPGETLLETNGDDEPGLGMTVSEAVRHWDRFLPLIFIGLTTMLGFGWTIKRNRR